MVERNPGWGKETARGEGGPGLKKVEEGYIRLATGLLKQSIRSGQKGQREVIKRRGGTAEQSKNPGKGGKHLRPSE